MNLETLSRRDVAALLNVTERAVAGMVERGMPQRKPDSGHPLYFWPEVLKWYVEDKIRATEARRASGRRASKEEAKIDIEVPPLGKSVARKEAALAALREHELAVKRGEYLRAEEVRKTFFSVARRTRDFLLALPDRIAPMVTDISDQHSAHRLLTEEMRRACTELAAPRLYGE